MTFLLGLPSVLLGLARRALGFIGQLQPFQLVSLALALLSAFLWLNGVHSRHEAAKWKKLAGQCAELRKLDARNWQAAADAATAANKAQIAKVETRQATITKDVTDDYETRLAALRAADRLRANAKADRGRANGDRASALPVAAPGADGQAVPFSGSDLLLAQETELQLNALIDWNERQAAVDPNASH